MRKTVALVVAAGKGLRTGSALPKQYAMLAGKAVVAHSVDAFLAHPGIDRVLVVIGDGQEALASTALGSRNVEILTGGAERIDSVRAGLAAAGDADRVLIHDAARPGLSAAIIDALLAALDTHEGAVPALPVPDTLACKDGLLGDTVDRGALVRVQTPQAFRADALASAHVAWTGGAATDDAQILRAAGYSVAIVDGASALDKLTYPEDMDRMERLMSADLISVTGSGYDVHRLVEGDELWLCGVLVPHNKGLSGHSDADVALHALVDALLGAMALGDIGAHFPPSDPQWRGAASSRFVEHARDLIEQAGGIIDHVDVTIICEAPKIGPHRDAMQASVAALLRLDVRQVSIKATTTERLGFTGRGEGIAAQAVASLRRKRIET